MGCILIFSDSREGRCWQRLEDRWWWVVGLRMGRIGGLLAGQISSLQLWRRNKLIWQWQMNHLLFPNCQFYASQIPFSPSVSSLSPPHRFLHEHPQPVSSSRSSTKLFFSLTFLFLTLFYFSFVLSMMPFHFFASHSYLPLPYFCFVAVKVWQILASKEVLLHSVFAYLVHLVAYLVSLIDRLIVAYSEYFSDSVSCHLRN